MPFLSFGSLVTQYSTIPLPLHLYLYTFYLQTDLSDKHASLKCDIKPEAINKMLHNMGTPSFGIAVTENRVAFTLNQQTKQLNKIVIPDVPPKKVMTETSSTS